VVDVGDDGKISDLALIHMRSPRFSAALYRQSSFL
jgi:hypothetical protein